MSFHSDIKPMIKALKKIGGWKRSVALDHMEIWLKTINDRRTLRLYFLRDVESHALTFSWDGAEVPFPSTFKTEVEMKSAILTETKRNPNFRKN